MPGTLRDAPHLLIEALERGQALLRAELRLARAELSDGLSEIGTGIGWYVAAGVAGLTALHALAAAAVLGLIELGIAPVLAALIVAAVLLVVGLICAATAKRKLSAAKAAPGKALRRLETDIDTVREATHV